MDRRHQWDPEPQERDPGFVRQARGVHLRRDEVTPEAPPASPEAEREILERKVARLRRIDQSRANVEEGRRVGQDATVWAKADEEGRFYLSVRGEPELLETLIKLAHQALEEGKEKAARRVEEAREEGERRIARAEEWEGRQRTHERDLQRERAE